MANHARNQAVKAVQDTLLGLATTGDSVFTESFYTLEPDDLPAIAVAGGGGDESDPENEDASHHQIAYDVNLNIEIAVQQRIGAQDEIDQIDVEVHKAIYADRTLGGVALEIYRAGLSETTLLEDRSRPLALAVLSYVVRIRTDKATPDIAVG